MLIELNNDIPEKHAYKLHLRAYFVIELRDKTTSGQTR